MLCSVGSVCYVSKDDRKWLWPFTKSIAAHKWTVVVFFSSQWLLYRHFFYFSFPCSCLWFLSAFLLIKIRQIFSHPFKKKCSCLFLSYRMHTFFLELRPTACSTIHYEVRGLGEGGIRNCFSLVVTGSGACSLVFFARRLLVFGHGSSLTNRTGFNLAWPLIHAHYLLRCRFHRTYTSKASSKKMQRGTIILVSSTWLRRLYDH